MIRFSFIVVACWIVIASTFQSAVAFDGNRKGFVLGGGVGVGVISDLEDVGVGLQTNLKIGHGISDRLLLYYSGNSCIFESGVLLEPTAALSYYLHSGTPTVYFTGGLGLTIAGSVMGATGGAHFLVGAGVEVFRHWSVELSAISMNFGGGWSINYALTVNVLGF